jgi:hypothetical protein
MISFSCSLFLVLLVSMCQSVHPGSSISFCSFHSTRGWYHVGRDLSVGSHVCLSVCLSVIRFSEREARSKQRNGTSFVAVPPVMVITGIKCQTGETDVTFTIKQWFGLVPTEMRGCWKMRKTTTTHPVENI